MTDIRALTKAMQGKALCNSDPEAFFPVDPETPNLPQWARDRLAAEPEIELYLREGSAIQLCAACPVRTACLGLADVLDDVSPMPVQGIWGGLTLAGRRKRKRQFNREARRREIARSIPDLMLHRT